MPDRVSRRARRAISERRRDTYTTGIAPYKRTHQEHIMKTTKRFTESPASLSAATDPQQRADNAQRTADHCQQLADRARESAEAAVREHAAAEQGVAQAEEFARQTAALLPDIEAKLARDQSYLDEYRQELASLTDPKEQQ